MYHPCVVLILMNINFNTNILLSILYLFKIVLILFKYTLNLILINTRKINKPFFSSNNIALSVSNIFLSSPIGLNNNSTKSIAQYNFRFFMLFRKEIELEKSVYLNKYRGITHPQTFQIITVPFPLIINTFNSSYLLFS